MVVTAIQTSVHFTVSKFLQKLNSLIWCSICEGHSMCSKVGKDYCAENPEFNFINKTLACKKRALHTKQALELTVWLLVNINFRGKANHYFFNTRICLKIHWPNIEHVSWTVHLVKKAKGRQIFDKSILMENVKPLWTSMYKACNICTLKFEIEASHV